MLTQADLKAIVGAVSPLIDARAKTTETFIKGEIAAVKVNLRGEIKASAKRLTEKIEEGNKQILETIIRTADEIISQQEPRLSQIEDVLDIPHPKKN